MDNGMTPEEEKAYQQARGRAEHRQADVTAETKTSKLLPLQRRQYILELIGQRKAVRVANLAILLGVTEETVRRDIMALARGGLVIKEHGGAVAVTMAGERSYGVRAVTNHEAKERIARIAASHVSNGSTIILDSGTTTGELAKYLQNKWGLTVITNGISHVETLLRNSTTSIVIVGGTLRRKTIGTCGELAAEMLAELHADQVFLAAEGFSVSSGISYPTFEELAVKRAMIAAARERILLADGSKCGKVCLTSIAPLTCIDLVITSETESNEEIELIKKLGVEIVVA